MRGASGRTVGRPLAHLHLGGQDRSVILTRALADTAARTGREVARVANNNRNNASLPRAGD
jgi:hypothetical protein